MTEQDIINLVKEDEWMMNVLREAEKLNLPDWIIGAGFLRNKVWDALHGFKREVADTRDVDLAYFDGEVINRDADKTLSEKMGGVFGLEWEIINQAYTHLWHRREKPYRSASEALGEWVETATCVAVTLRQGEPIIVAPHGIGDLVNLILRPSPSHKQDLDTFYDRIKSKNWLQKWPNLRVDIV